MKKNLLLTTLLLATTLTFTACGKSEEAPVEESTVAMEETVVEEVETETVTVEEEPTEEEETLSMTEEEIRTFLEEVRDMNYESYTYNSRTYFTDIIDSEGNTVSDNISDGTNFYLDSLGNVLIEHPQLTADRVDLLSGDCQAVFFNVDGSYATNRSDVDTSADWDTYKADELSWKDYTKFFGCYSTVTVDTLVNKAIVTEYNERPVLYINNITDDTEESFLEYLNFSEETVVIENSFSYDVYLYLDVPGEYFSSESIRVINKEGYTYTVYDICGLSDINSTVLPEIPESYIKF